jgi:histidine ammonia-lyase
LRGVAPGSLGAALREPYASLRARVPPLDEDRPLGPAVDRVAAMLAERLLTVESP